MTETFLDSKEAAHILKLSPQTLNNWRTQGRGPAFRKAGRKVIYARSDIDAWMDANKFNNTQEASCQHKKY